MYLVITYMLIAECQTLQLLSNVYCISQWNGRMYISSSCVTMALLRNISNKSHYINTFIVITIINVDVGILEISSNMTLVPRCFS